MNNIHEKGITITDINGLQIVGDLSAWAEECEEAIKSLGVSVQGAFKVEGDQAAKLQAIIDSLQAQEEKPMESQRQKFIHSKMHKRKW